MSRNVPSGDGGSVYLRKIGWGSSHGGAESSRPGEAGPESIGVVVGRDGSAREQLEAILAAARDLRPQLKADQAETEERGVYSAQMHEAFVEAGFFHVLLPKSLGGLELGVEAFYQMITEVARGCASTAWCLCLSAGHTLLLSSYWPEQAQREIFGEHGYLVSPMSSNAQKDVVVTRGERDGMSGVRLSGTWKYCSGSPHSTHFMASFALPPEGDGEPTVHVAVVPRSSYTVLDDWGAVIGMRGSGSHSIRIDDAFVPEHHVVESNWMTSVSGDTIGSQLYGNPTYGGPFMGFAEGEIAAIIAGLGLAAIDEYEDIITTTKAPWSDGEQRRCEHPVWQGKFGTALALVDSAVAISARVGQLYEEYARRSVASQEPFSAERILRLNNMALIAEAQVWDAIEMMLRSAGSRYSTSGSRLLRYFRDMLTARTSVDQLDLFAVPTTLEHLAVSGR
jgi:3-hydroxy-9,10-secoandrosta-1,3,5(10)-triene-9,17-dione monooxygenase